MSTIDLVKRAQVQAGEDAVIANLRAKGLLPPIQTNAEIIERLQAELDTAHQAEKSLSGQVQYLDAKCAEMESAKQINADAVEIADSAARLDIEIYSEPNSEGWYNTAKFIDRAVRYLAARNLIERKTGEEAWFAAHPATQTVTTQPVSTPPLQARI